MSAIGYCVTLIPGVSTPLRVTALEGDGRDVPVRGTTLADAADAILTDHVGRRLPLSDVCAFAALAFGGLGESRTLAITVRGETVARFIDAAQRVAG